MIYVGEAEDAYSRLKQHNKAKEFWTSAIAIVSKTQHLTKTHIKYLEWFCHQEASSAGRYSLENTNVPTKPFVSEPMEADLQDNFETLKLLVSTLGHPIFDKITQPKPSGKDAQRGTMTIKKAVFPAAGFGTRFLPATKAIPKEMLPLVDKPLIQYAVEEAKASGLSEIVIVTGVGKTAIEDHFDTSFEIEMLLRERDKMELLKMIENVSGLTHFSYTRQKKPLGLGHAIGITQNLINDEPFAVFLSDDIIDSEVPVMKQMTEVFKKYGTSILAVQKVPRVPLRLEKLPEPPDRPPVHRDASPVTEKIFVTLASGHFKIQQFQRVTIDRMRQGSPDGDHCASENPGINEGWGEHEKREAPGQ